MEYKGYIGSAEIDPEAKVCHGKLLYIRDLVTYEAQTPKEMEGEFHAAVDDYLETCQQVGKEPDVPCKGTFNVRIPPELHMKANIAASKKGMQSECFCQGCLETCNRGNKNPAHSHA